MTLTIGSDPEFFLTDTEGNVLPSQERIPGTKEHPEKVNYGMIHRDNVAVEINTIPAESSDEFIQNTTNLIQEVRALIEPSGLDILIQPGAEFDELDILHPEALTFGCEGDLDAWFMEEPTAPDPFSVGNYRSAGGHIHLGFPEEDNEFRLSVAKTLDALVGMPSVLLDSDQKRRKLYGQGGRVRIKPYGVEYRVPSNFWLQSEQYMAWVFEQARIAYENPLLINDLIRTEESAWTLRQTINSSDVSQAQKWCHEWGINVPEAA